MKHFFRTWFSLICSAALFLAPVHRAQADVIVIDPGHGGSKSSGTQAARTLSSSNNATSPGGLLEKDLTLELSLEIQKQVQALARSHPQTRLECLLTRTDDSNPDFAKRAAFCAQTKPTPRAIISIHFNASTNHRGLGTLAVIHNQKQNANYAQDRAFATGLIAATHSGVVPFVPASKAQSPITDSHLHNGTGSNFFYQLSTHPHLAQVPKCFLEIEFMDRREVEDRLLQDRARTFPAIAKAIAEYLYSHCSSQQ